jgi:hypothetical protein
MVRPARPSAIELASPAMANTMRREIPEFWVDQIETFLGKRETPFMEKA